MNSYNILNNSSLFFFDYKIAYRLGTMQKLEFQSKNLISEIVPKCLLEYAGN